MIKEEADRMARESARRTLLRAQEMVKHARIVLEMAEKAATEAQYRASWWEARGERPKPRLCGCCAKGDCDLCEQEDCECKHNP